MKAVVCILKPGSPSSQSAFLPTSVSPFLMPLCWIPLHRLWLVSLCPPYLDLSFTLCMSLSLLLSSKLTPVLIFLTHLFIFGDSHVSPCADHLACVTVFLMSSTSYSSSDLSGNVCYAYLLCLLELISLLFITVPQLLFHLSLDQWSQVCLGIFTYPGL